MDIGKQLRRARLEAGMSQRQLCGELITRNMLSQIENGAALPSIPTLVILADRLHKPVGYFFGEEVPEDPLEPVREALDNGQPELALERLQSTEGGTVVRRQLLRYRALMAQAVRAASEGRKPYALKLLKEAGENPLPQELERSRLLLLGELQEDPGDTVRQLPSMDRELLLRAEAALKEGSLPRAGQLLDAAEDQTTVRWAMLRGRVYLEQKQYEKAAACFHQAEQEKPDECARYLEICYRELEDFRQAYFYACRQKNTEDR